MMKRMTVLNFFIFCVICMFLAAGGTAPSLYAKGKGKEKAAKKAKSRGYEKHQKESEEETGDPVLSSKNKKKDKKWMPPGLSKKEKAEWIDGVPPGWSRGKKKGWGGSDVPPGFSKWKKRDQKKWKKDLVKARKKTDKWALERSRKYQWSEEKKAAEAESLYISVDRTARAGVPVDRIQDLVEKAIKKDLSSEDIERLTRAVAHGVGKGLGAEDVVTVSEKVIDGEINDEDIALAVYRWIASEEKRNNS
ncbi:MAG: hypothetical protein JRJ85_05895 [Deltaproteobacteria bacterium]|nr:hypothetical protein [Deltaproteobacteria bacterium]